MEQPTTYTTQEALKPNAKWFQSWRIIYPLLGVVLLFELLTGLKTLLTPIPKVANSQAPKLHLSSGAQILLSAAKTSFNIGEQVPVTIQVSTGGYATIGTDLVFHFNPFILEALPNSFVHGKIYSDYPLVDIDNKKGVVRISGIASNPKQAFNGKGELGVVNFKAKGKGINTFKIDFIKGQTGDSNIMLSSSSKDVLEGVNNLKITVQ